MFISELLFILFELPDQPPAVLEQRAGIWLAQVKVKLCWRMYPQVAVQFAVQG